MIQSSRRIPQGYASTMRRKDRSLLWIQSYVGLLQVLLALNILLQLFHSSAVVGFTAFTTTAPLHVVDRSSPQRIHKSQHWKPSKVSMLHQSSSSSSSNDNSSSNQNNKKKQSRIRRFLDPNNKNKKNPLKDRLQKALKSLVAFKNQTKSRFQALPRRAKRIVIVQLFCIACVFGGMSRTIYRRTTGYAGGGGLMSPPPIEIPYSRFLDLVEQQKQQTQSSSSSSSSSPKTGSSSSSTAVSNGIPVMDNVRIGTDRIVYRLYRRADVEASQSETTAEATSEQLSTSTSTSSSTTSVSATAADTVPPASSASTSPRERALQQLQQMRQKNIERRLAKKNSNHRKQRIPVVAAYTRKVSASPQLMDSLRENEVHFSALIQPRQSALTSTLRTMVVLFYFLILWRLYRTVSGGGGGIAGGGGKGDTPGKLAQTSDLPLASFEDIQGVDMAKQEVMELVDTLRHPDKYSILGARAPTGLLLEGSPGTGKTMLARATAASAGVPLLYCSGSDFVEMFVGRGAARVRKLFERAGKLAPCLIFIDELDALGKSRDATLGRMGGRSNDEQEQTLNQLLACMDGLDTSRRICVMAATNRKEVLDPALIRPGRFDRIVHLELPDTKGRENILRVHCKKLPGFKEGSGVDPNRQNALGCGRVVDLQAVAAVTEGFSGAELEFLVNEAAIRAVRRVSAALREGQGGTAAVADDITPHVEASDFEASLQNFYQTRRSSTGMPDLFKNMFKS